MSTAAPPPIDDLSDDPTTLTDAAPHRAGRRIANRYDVVRLIAEGGMGEVLLARHTDLDRLVAVKVMHRRKASAPDVDFDFAEQFRSEARVLASFDHPNIVTLYDFGLLGDDRPFLAMEYVEGSTLSAMLKRGGPFPASRVTALALQIGSALRYAHQRGVVHRDLTPSNVLLKIDDDGQEQVKLVDFGIAQVGPADQDASDVVVGSPHCMAPEQIDGVGVDGRTDLYALGVVMYRLLTGRWPFSSRDTVAIMMSHLHEEPPPMAKVAPDLDIPPALEAVVMRCLRKQQIERFRTAEAFLEALCEASDRPTESWRVGTTAVTAPTVNLRRTSLEVSRTSEPALVGMVGVIVIATLLALSSLLVGPSDVAVADAPRGLDALEEPTALAAPATLPPAPAPVDAAPAKAAPKPSAKPSAKASTTASAAAKPAPPKPAAATKAAPAPKPAAAAKPAPVAPPTPAAQPAARTAPTTSPAAAPRGYQGVPDDF